MRHWRWVIVIGGVAALVAAPIVLAARPVARPPIDPAVLQQRILASSAQPHQGLFESRGGLHLPDLGPFDAAVAPWSSTTRVRVWFAAPDHWRADELLTGAERGTYREPEALWRWDSGTRKVIHAERTGAEPLRVPRPIDLSPAELGRRVLAAAGGEGVQPIDARRIGGIVAAGLRVVPDPATGTTVTSADIWAEPATGLVLAVEIHAGAGAPALETAFVDIELGDPAAEVLRFDPFGADITVRESPTADDPVEAVGAMTLADLPEQLAGMPRRSPPGSGAASYGDGLAVVHVLAVPDGTLSDDGAGALVLSSGARPWGGSARTLETALVNAEVLDTDLGIDLVVVGTVTIERIDQVAAALVDGGWT